VEILGRVLSPFCLATGDLAAECNILRDLVYEEIHGNASP